MKRVLPVVLAAAIPFIVASCATGPRPAVLKKEAASKPPSLRGIWREVMNENVPVKGGKFWTFEGDRVSIADGSETYKGTFIANNDREPKEIDIRFEGYPVNRGIYRLSGDMLTVKVLDTATSRPTRLGIEKGYTSIMCERAAEKPAAEAAKK